MKKNSSTYRIFEHIRDVDISEQDIYDYDIDILNQLLIDHTMSAKARAEANDQNKVVNIFWATSDYEGTVMDEKGHVIVKGYQYKDEIKPENITGRNQRIVMPRVLKDKQAQIDRTKDKAEVFTPSWVCNAQNNLIDEAWFGRKEVFNQEITNEDGSHTWIPTSGKITFPEGDSRKTWKKYIVDNRMEITCGEAPYLVSRYDTTTGESIPIDRRIGLLDRKLRVINENVDNEKDWYTMAEKAFKHTYGYEWQGDNLLLAREALLYTYIEYFMYKFNDKDAEGNYVKDANGEFKVPDKRKILNAARWISWNIWQMDGLKMVVPDSCDNQYETDLFGLKKKKVCDACSKGKMIGHIGVKCIIRDWNLKKPKKWKPKPGEDPHSQPWQKIEFSSLFFGRNMETEEEEIK